MPSEPFDRFDAETQVSVVRIAGLARDMTLGDRHVAGLMLRNAMATVIEEMDSDDAVILPGLMLSECVTLLLLASRAELRAAQAGL